MKLRDAIVPPEGGEPREVDCINHFKDCWYIGLAGASSERLKRGERVKRPPVLASDGEPIEVGQTVYATHYGYVKCTVLAIEWVVDGYLVEVENEGGHKFRQTPDEFIHQRPVLDADGVLCREGDEVWEVRSHRRREIVGTHYCDYRTGEPLILCDGDDAVPIPATCVTHAKPEPPDTWERIEGEIERGKTYTDELVLSIVRRCRAMAERGEL